MKFACYFMKGDAKVSVADCTRCYFSTHPKTEMTVMEFLKYWKSHDHKDANCKDDRLLYLKDWHFILYVCMYDVSECRHMLLIHPGSFQSVVVQPTTPFPLCVVIG